MHQSASSAHVLLVSIKQVDKGMDGSHSSMNVPSKSAQGVQLQLTSDPRHSVLNPEPIQMPRMLLQAATPPVPEHTNLASTKVRVVVAGRTQMLWRKYGAKTIVPTATREGCFRSYYKCFNQACTARLVEDAKSTGRMCELMGVHNHVLEFPTVYREPAIEHADVTYDKFCEFPQRGRLSCPMHM